MTDTESGTDKAPIDFRTHILNWLLQQGVSTILLTAQTASIIWIGYYLVDKTIPNSIQQIQTGYEQAEKRHEQSLKLIIDSFEKTTTRFQSQFRKSSTNSADQIYDDEARSIPCG